MADMTKALKLEQVAILKTYIDKEDLAKLTEAKGYTDAEIVKVNAASTALEGRVTTAEGKITTLVGDDADKSVRTIANEELAAQLIPEGAKEALDTLKEIADWIQKHPDDAAAMNSAIEALETLVGEIPEGATSTTIVAYISEVVNAAQTTINEEVAKKANKLTGDAISADQILVDDGTGDLKGSGKTVASIATDIGTAKSEAISTAADDATSKANTAESNAKSYADSLAPNYDEAGAASAVQGETEETVASVDAKISTINTTTIPNAVSSANTYADGVASTAKSEAISAVQGETTATVADVKAVVDSMGYATDAEVRALLGLPAPEVTE